jgi:hypothetical protein
MEGWGAMRIECTKKEWCLVSSLLFKDLCMLEIFDLPKFTASAWHGENKEEIFHFDGKFTDEEFT